MRDDSSHAGRPRGREKVVSALGSQPIRQGKLAVEPAKVQARGDCGQLVNDRVGSGPHDGPDGRLTVQCIQDLCLYSLRHEVLRLRGRPRGSNDNVSGFAQ